MIEMLAYIVAILMPFTTTFHMGRMVKEKSSKGQSIWGPLGLTVGSLIWLLYGISILSWPLIITNIIWIVLNLITVALIVVYRSKKFSIDP